MLKAFRENRIHKKYDWNQPSQQYWIGKTIKEKKIWGKDFPPKETIYEICKGKIKSVSNMQGFIF